MTEELTRTAKASDATAKKGAFLGDEALVVLVSTVALANFTNRFNEGLAVELEK